MGEQQRCPSCNGSGRVHGLGVFAAEMRVLHLHGDDPRVQDEGTRCKTCDGTGDDVTADRPESPGFTCMGCGASAVGEFWPHSREWRKPGHWYSRSDADGEQLACSRGCISTIAKATGKPKAVMPW